MLSAESKGWFLQVSIPLSAWTWLDESSVTSEYFCKNHSGILKFKFSFRKEKNNGVASEITRCLQKFCIH